MKRKRSRAWKTEAITLILYGVWLLFLIFAWKTEWVKPNQVTLGLALVFGALVIVLINCIRGLPQLRMTKPGLSPEVATRLVRLRITWLAEFKLILVSGFAITSLALLAGNVIRTVLSVILLAVVLLSLIRFLVRSHRVEQPTVARNRR